MRQLFGSETPPLAGRCPNGQAPILATMFTPVVDAAREHAVALIHLVKTSIPAVGNIIPQGIF